MPEPKDKPDKHEQARRLAEAALRAQATGNDAEAARLLEQAERTDPEAVANVLQERDVVLTPDRVEPSPDDDEVAEITETVEPRGNAPSRAGIAGSGTGADTEKR